MMNSQTYQTLFERGLTLSRRQLHHAALEVWDQLLKMPSGTPAQVARAWDESGRIHILLGNPKQALDCFLRATTHGLPEEDETIYAMHLALAYRRVSDNDRALRILTQISESRPQLSPRHLAALYNNLALVQAYHGFYQEALRNTQRCLTYLSEKESPTHAVLYNNLGLHHLELGNLSEAEDWLLRADRLNQGRDLAPISELSRLHMIRGDLNQSLFYAERTLALVWPSLIGFEKEEIARLCQTLATLARYLGERSVAVRLIEKAQLFFGQVGLWREWEQAQMVMDDWLDNTPVVGPKSLVQSRELQQFVFLLDALNAQELIMPEFDTFLDNRVHYAQAFADALDLNPSDRELLTYACRFADFGLTAIEPDVIGNPTRSEHAWGAYRQHPILSLRMLDTMGMPDEVMMVIREHHEAYDGSGYPHGKCGTEISPLARIFAIADEYAHALVFEKMTHTQSLEEICHKGKSRYQPDLLARFAGMFEV